MAAFGSSIAATVIVLLLVSHQTLESSPLSINTDSEALLSFKSQITAQGEADPLSTWHRRLSPCNWTRVSCDNQARRVIGLDLSNLGMTGTISPSIGNLSFLRSLELQNNQFTGELPHQLGDLARLRTLNVSYNGIGGVLPPNISRCESLVTLDLMQNMISGRIPPGITDLTQLQVLNLAGNRLSGDLPSFLSNVSSLVELNLGTNTLTGPIPSELGRLLNLRSLDLSINNLFGVVPPSIYNMSSLVYLAFASNNLGGELPGNIASTLPNLLGFNFCINNFTGTIPWSLHNLTNLKSIRMARNLLHGSVPPGLGNLHNLEMYNIGFNSIVNSGQGGLDFLELLTNSTRLNFLAIDFNLLEGPIPRSIGNLSKSLTKLFMGGNDIYGTIPSSIGELRALELLNMSYSSLSGEIPSEIGLLKELRVLALADNGLSGEIPSHLGDLRFLTRIDMSKNNLVGTIPDSLGNLKNLISMDLSSNMLNGSISKEILSSISGLSAFLNLSQNYLSGPLPVEIGSLENVAVINISDNMLSGNVPASVGDCKSLEILSLSRNMLVGTIPSTLGSVRGLETLDLSSNQLSGSIPTDLQNLQSLKLLNLSFNSLEGEIPTDGVFADPLRVHLESNRNLCSGESCKNHRGSGKKLTAVYITVSVAVVVSLCSATVFLYYIRRGKGRVKDSVESLNGQHQMVSYDELRVATDNFNEENLIGRGGFGSVYKGLVQGVDAAIKVLDTTLAKSRKTFLAECRALGLLRHRNLIKLSTVCSSIDSKNEEFLALIFEFMSNGSLDDWITGKRRLANGIGLSFFDRLRFAVEIASALDYLHNETEVPIVHCDLKPSNVLLDSDMTPKVGDFGLAKLMLDVDNQMSLSSSHALRGSIGYIPPEYGYGEKPSTAGDVYSYGILLLELFTGRSPTHETFTGGLSVKSWVQMHFPTNIDQVLDFDLLQETMNFSNVDHPSKQKTQRDCLISVLGVGLSCADESPDARLTIRDALHSLKDVEKMLRKLCVGK